MADVVIVGAGMGGLAAAIDLAARGVEVVVVEAGPRPGGKADIVEIDGVEVDTGPSVLTLPDVLAGLFDHAGTSLEAELTLVEPEPAFRYLYPDGTALDVHVDPERTASSVEATLGPDARGDFEAFLAYSKRIWDASADAFVFGQAPSLPRILGLGPSAWMGLARIDATRSMWQAIRRRVRDPRLQALFARYATYNGSDPRVAPATLNCIAHVELALGGYGVQGGMYALVRALVRTAEGLGVTIRTSTPARRLEVRRDRVCGVVLADGSVIEARAVVSNVDVAHLVADLLPGRSATAVRPAQTPSMSGWVGILRARRQARVAHTVLFPDDYEAEFADIFDRSRPPADPTLYLCAQSVAHHRQGWDDHEPLFMMTNAPALRADGSDPDHPGFRGHERLVRAGLAQPDDEVVWERAPAALATRFPRSRGAIYGASSNSLFAAFRRPSNRVRRLGGLYLATGSAHPGGGVPLCILSGRLAASAAAEDLGLLEAVA